MRNAFILYLFAIIFLTGCAQPVVYSIENTKPSWIINPNQDGKVGAIGVAAITYDQKISTQRKLAISRALEELSLQQGVKVNMSIQKKERVQNNQHNTYMDTDSEFHTNSNISAHVESAWEDKITKELYLWMVLD